MCNIKNIVWDLQKTAHGPNFIVYFPLYLHIGNPSYRVTEIGRFNSNFVYISSQMKVSNKKHKTIFIFQLINAIPNSFPVLVACELSVVTN